jgi:Mrp family chromosome partitioning ATPase
VARLLAAIRSGGPVLLLSVLISVAVAVYVSTRREKEYTAHTVVVIRDPSADTKVAGGVTPPPDPSPQAQVEPTAQLIQTLARPEVVAAARRSLPRSISAAELRDMVSVGPHGTSGAVAIEARAARAALAARVADAVTQAAVRVTAAATRRRYEQAAADLRRERRAAGNGRRGTGSTFSAQISALRTLATLAEPIQIEAGARIPSSPDQPRPVRDGIVGGIIGLAGGLVLLAARRTRRRPLTAETLSEEIGLTLLGSVPERLMGSVPLGAEAAAGPALEPFRIVLRNLAFLGEEDLRAVTVTSGVAEEGKSTVAASLAFAAAVSGRRTMLVEADLRRPVLAARLRGPAGPGLSECLLGEIPVEECAHEIEVAPALTDRPDAAPAGVLRYLPAGRAGEAAVERLDSGAMADLLAALRRDYDLVVVDTPPLLAVGDALTLVAASDAVVLCARVGRTTADETLAALDALVRTPFRPTGLVATGTDEADTGYGYGYGHPGRSRLAGRLPVGAGR